MLVDGANLELLEVAAVAVRAARLALGLVGGQLVVLVAHLQLFLLSGWRREMLSAAVGALLSRPVEGEVAGVAANDQLPARSATGGMAVADPALETERLAVAVDRLRRPEEGLAV